MVTLGMMIWNQAVCCCLLPLLSRSDGPVEHLTAQPSEYLLFIRTQKRRSERKCFAGARLLDYANNIFGTHIDEYNRHFTDIIESAAFGRPETWNVRRWQYIGARMAVSILLAKNYTLQPNQTKVTY
jgi:hypothetical protein